MFKAISSRFIGPCIGPHIASHRLLIPAAITALIACLVLPSHGNDVQNQEQDLVNQTANSSELGAQVDHSTLKQALSSSETFDRPLTSSRQSDNSLPIPEPAVGLFGGLALLLLLRRIRHYGH